MKKITVSMTLLLIFTAFAILERALIYGAPNSSWTIKQMTKNDVEDTLGRWHSISLDGSRIVFDRRPPPNWGPDGYGVYWDVYTMRIEDEPGQERQMTTVYGHDAEGGISGDGNKIAFHSGRFNAGEPWDTEIFVMNFSDNPGQEAQVSDNSTYLDHAVTINNNGEIIAWHTGPNTAYKHGEYITVANVSDINHITYTIIDTPQWDMYPTVSGDGKKVCFTQVDSNSKNSIGVFLANSDGTGLMQIPGATGQGVISGDGSKVAIWWNDGDYEISVYDIATGNMMRITDNNVDDMLGSINYHANIVAYDRGGEIYTYNLQTLQETQLTFDTYEDYRPRLDEDGDTIVFVSIGRDGPNAEIFVMTLTEVTATINIDPDTLNLKSNGQWITAYITLPDNYPVENVDVSTVELKHNDVLVETADWGEIQDGILMAKFDRAALREYLGEVDLDGGDKFYDVTLTVRGEVAGTPFKGADTITIIKK